MNRSLRTFLAPTFAAAVFAFATNALAAACRAESGPTTTPVFELYTSEGCDSCPPADRWFSKNFPRAAASSPIALAFHVDYWDRLGWKDRFASARFTDRQYAAMRANGGDFVYTPQVLLQGRPFTRWEGADPAAFAKVVSARPARVQISVQASIGGSQVAIHVDARRVAASDASPGSVYVAYTDNGLFSRVTAGENRGARLDHDHVVRALSDPLHVAGDGSLHADLALPLPTERGAAPSVVAWMQDDRSGEILQAVSVPLADCVPSH